MIHFGCNLRKQKDDLVLSRNNYMHKKRNGEYSFRFGGNWSPEAIAERESLNLANFDMNMQFYEQLDRVKFDHQLNQLRSKFPELEEVVDLTRERERYGIYILVLDEYKQIYVGKTFKNFFDRIRQHWKANVEFDRLIFCDPKKSKLAIDSFRALDTTRIFVMPLLTEEDAVFEIERRIVEMVEEDFLANRLSGGSVNWTNVITPYMSERIKLRNF